MIGHGVAAAGVAVSMLTGAFAPAHVDVLAGDTVTWSNDSVRRHTVSAADGGWGSASIFSGGSYARAFDVPVSIAYYCTVHPFMRGEVAVHRLLLSAPRDPGVPGRPYTLSGRAALPAGTSVAIEGDSGSGYRPVAWASVGQDGSFRATVLPATGTTYRAVGADGASPGVPLTVLDRTVQATSTRHGGQTVVRVRVTPASPHATVLLELDLRERFGWWPVRRIRLDHHSRGTFRLRLHRRFRSRAVLTLADGATPLVHSAVLRIGRRR